MLGWDWGQARRSNVHGISHEGPPTHTLHCMSPHSSDADCICTGLCTHITPIDMCATQPKETLPLFVATAKGYSIAELETFAYMLGVADGNGSLVVKGLYFPEQKCSGDMVSVVALVGNFRIRTRGPEDVCSPIAIYL